VELQPVTTFENGLPRTSLGILSVDRIKLPCGDCEQGVIIHLSGADIVVFAARQDVDGDYLKNLMESAFSLGLISTDLKISTKLSEDGLCCINP
jgi:hypothetical protein